VQALRPERVVVGQRLAQPRPVAQTLDVLRCQPCLGQQLAGEHCDQPARIESVGLGPLVALQRACLPGICELHFDPACLQLARHPPPPSRRLERDHSELAVVLLDPGDQLIPRGLEALPGDPTTGKTDRRDAKRLVRLFAAGELSFVFVPSEEDERFRDLVRCIDDARKDLMRSRHRLSKFLLRRGMRFPGRPWTQPHARWLGTRRFDDALSQAVFIDYCCAVDALVQRRATLIGVLEAAVPASGHAATVARLRCFRGIDTLSAAELCADVGSFERFAKPALLSGFLGIAFRRRTERPARRPKSPRVFPGQIARHAASLAAGVNRGAW
jgi:hypothetical protein